MLIKQYGDREIQGAPKLCIEKSDCANWKIKSKHMSAMDNIRDASTNFHRWVFYFIELQDASRSEDTIIKVIMAG